VAVCRSRYSYSAIEIDTIGGGTHKVRTARRIMQEKMRYIVRACNFLAIVLNPEGHGAIWVFD
jgi:hypothetical protein